MATGSVLIVEDEVDLEGRGLEAMLAAAGFSMLGIATTTEEAVARAKRLRPTVVVMDIMLGQDERGGVKAARQIREEVGSQIVFLTGTLVSRELGSAAWKTRPFAFLTKPVTDKQLVATVGQACGEAGEGGGVFVCCSRADRAMADELVKYIEQLDKFGVKVWLDQQIEPGDDPRLAIEEAIGAARLAVLLIGESFAESRWIRDVELPAILRRRVSQNLNIFVAYLGCVSGTVLERLGLSGIPAINSPGDPLEKWSIERRNKEAWGQVCEMLGETLGMPLPTNR